MPRRPPCATCSRSATWAASRARSRRSWTTTASSCSGSLPPGASGLFGFLRCANAAPARPPARRAPRPAARPARPMVGLDAWRPWKCDPSAGDVCAQTTALEKMGAAACPLRPATLAWPLSARCAARSCGRRARRRAGKATSELEQQVAAEQARVAGLRQREVALQAAVGRLEAAAASEAAAAAQRVQQLERARADDAAAARAACAQARRAPRARARARATGQGRARTRAPGPQAEEQQTFNPGAARRGWQSSRPLTLGAAQRRRRSSRPQACHHAPMCGPGPRAADRKPWRRAAGRPWTARTWWWCWRWAWPAAACWASWRPPCSCTAPGRPRTWPPRPRCPR